MSIFLAYPLVAAILFALVSDALGRLAERRERRFRQRGAK